MFSERFLQLYNDELRYFREAGRQFASSHPQVAQHLGMHIDGVLDPFVERLLEGSAFLCTRIQEKLNNEQPEFALQMLSRLAPLWYTPVPAIATVAIKPDLSFPPVAQPGRPAAREPHDPQRYLAEQQTRHLHHGAAY